jgi:hypothetical protein
MGCSKSDQKRWTPQGTCPTLLFEWVGHRATWNHEHTGEISAALVLAVEACALRCVAGRPAQDKHPSPLKSHCVYTQTCMVHCLPEHTQIVREQ